MEAVSRSNLFGSDVLRETHETGYGRPEIPDLQLEIREVQAAAHDEGPARDEDDEEFCLFGGETITTADLHEKQQEIIQERPNSYYFYRVTPEMRSQFEYAAVDGDRAAHWIPFVETTAPDINAGYKPPKKRCRPGSQSRKKKRQLHHEAKARAAEAAAAARWKRRRR